jgi:ACT domain-containing protein
MRKKHILIPENVKNEAYKKYLNYNNISVNDICEEFGMCRKTFYIYRNKQNNIKQIGGDNYEKKCDNNEKISKSNDNISDYDIDLSEYSKQLDNVVKNVKKNRNI